MKKPPGLQRIKKIHFTGIKGVGMTSLACCAQDLGLEVSGSDVAEVFVTDAVLKRRKISWRLGFSAGNLRSPDLLITTGAHGGLGNPEVKAAQAAGLPVITQAEGVGLFSAAKETLSVCGVGGKTTTSSLLATTLDSLGWQPSFSVGVGQIKPLGDPGRSTAGKYFVAEADEYAVSPGTDWRPRFIFQKPKVIICTNIEHDHPDVYPDLAAAQKTFLGFFNSLPADGLALVCVDNPATAALLSQIKAPFETYGFSPRADWRLDKLSFAPGKTFFQLHHRGVLLQDIVLNVPGRFNALNAAAVLAAIDFLGGSLDRAIKGLAAFGGTQRRFELVAENKNFSLFDDYAHHPTEIKATLKAAKEWFPSRPLVIIFQPHTFSRTFALLKEFSGAFGQADEVLIADIYASAREKPGEFLINSQKLAAEIGRFHPRVFYCPGLKEVLTHLSRSLKGGEVVFTLGAGDIFRWHPELVKFLKKNG